MGVRHVISGAGGSMDMNNEGVRAEATGNHCGVCCGLAYLQAVYRGRYDRGLYQVPTVEVPIPLTQICILGGTVKNR